MYSLGIANSFISASQIFQKMFNATMTHQEPKNHFSGSKSKESKLLQSFNYNYKSIVNTHVGITSTLVETFYIDKAFIVCIVKIHFGKI